MPLALLSLASTLVGRYEVVIVDRSVNKGDQELLALLSRPEAVVVGITVLTGTVIKDAIYCSRMVRVERPDVKVVWGGWHATKAPESILMEPYVDFIVQGEGEIVFPLLVDRLVAGTPLEGLPGVGWREKDSVRLSPPAPPLQLAELPPLPFELIKNIEPYVVRNLVPEGGRCLPIETSRGCPYYCSFCDISFHFGANYSSRTPEQIVDTIKLLKRLYNIGGIRFFDPNFFLNIKRARSFAQLLIEHKVNIKWGADGTIMQFRNVSEDDLTFFYRSGARFICFGVESGSERVRNDILNKKFSNQQCLEVLNRLAKVGVQIKINIMVGLPGETEKESLETVDFLMDVVSRFPGAGGRMSAYMPFPGTPLAESAQRKGFSQPKTLEEFSNTSYFGSHAMPWLSHNQKERVRSMALMTYFLSFGRNSIPHQGIRKIVFLVARWYYLFRMRHRLFARTPDIAYLEKILQ